MIYMGDKSFVMAHFILFSISNFNDEKKENTVPGALLCFELLNLKFENYRNVDIFPIFPFFSTIAIIKFY